MSSKIIGYSGRFPNSTSLFDFTNKLFEGIDLVTSDHSKYPDDYCGLPNRIATIPHSENFDNLFFGVNSIQTEFLDPQIRLGLESTYEAIQDSGYSIDELKGTQTGVYIGGCFSDHHHAKIQKMRNITGYENAGGSHAMFANRISYYFGLEGPSMTIDTACSSSLVALNLAVRDLKSGVIDRAIVGGFSLIYNPGISKSFQMYNMLSPDGKCYSFDERANGYVRAEGVGIILIESERIESKHFYAKILGTGVNNDGYKVKGITFPSDEVQSKLFKKVLEENDINPNHIEYLEAHGTGTVAGDGQELKAIDSVYGNNREVPLLIGSIKSNMGHAEGASGVMSMIKLLVAYETGVIPRNLNYESTTHEPITRKRMEVVSDNKKWNRGLSAINNFGFGGTNAHVILGPGNRFDSQEGVAEPSPCYVFGRSKESIEKYFQSEKLNNNYWNFIKKNAYNISKFPYRGIVFKDQKLINEVKEKPTIAFCYSGQGSQWNGMAKDLWKAEPIFKNTILNATKNIPIDIDSLFNVGDKWLNKDYSGLGITLVQIGLTDLLKNKYGIIPDFVFGHSVGEVASGYADGCNSAQETAEIAYVRCKLSQEVKAYGLMIAVGLTYELGKELLKNFPNVVIACHNAVDSLTLSGEENEIKAIITELKSRNVFVRLVETDGIAYHSHYFKKNYERIREELSKVIHSRNKRSARWLSTSEGSEEYSDGTYHTNNVTGEVKFFPVIEKLPQNTIVIEIGPHGLLKSQIKRSRSDVSVLQSMFKGKPANETLSEVVNELWLQGYNIPQETVKTSNFNQKTEMEWVREKSWSIPTYHDFGSSSEESVVYDLLNHDLFLKDHMINGYPLFPAMGHIYTIWKIIGLNKPVLFKNVKIFKAIILDQKNLELKVKLNDGEWKIIFNDEVVSSGEAYEKEFKPATPPRVVVEPDYFDDKTVYNYMDRFGYEYKNTFQVIEKRSLDCSHAIFKEANHWVTYLDGMLQVTLGNIKNLHLPTYIKSVSVNPADIKHLDLNVYYNSKTKIISSNNAIINGLEVTLSKVKYVDPTTNQIQWFKYGENEIENETNYTKYIFQYLVERFRKLQSTIKDDKYTFIDKISKVVLKNHQDIPLEECPQKEHHLFKPLIDHIYDNPSYLENLYLNISTHPAHIDFYFKDPCMTMDSQYFDILCQHIKQDFVKPFTILEVGAGTGGLTRKLYPIVAQEIQTYIATDISVIQSINDHIICKKWDLNNEWNGEKVDVIVGANSVHTCKNLPNGLKNISNALNEGGYLLLSELISHMPIMLWGLADFAWDIEDQREFALWCSKKHWFELLRNVGFEPITWFVDKCNTQMLLLCKKIKSNKIETIANVEDPFALRNYKNNAVIVKTETCNNGFLGFMKCLRREPGYEDIQLIQGNHQNIPVPYQINGGNYFEAPLQMNKHSNNGYHLEVLKPGDLSSMKFVNNHKKPNIQIKFTGLNFKDVMLSYGKLISESTVNLGLEFSGIETEKKSRVMGMASQCLATHIHCDKKLLWEVPSHMSLQEAATIPVVYATSYYSLVIKANILEGQTILIHSIAGGVGLASYHIAKFRGLNIIATCSKDKRKFVHEVLGIPENMILDSRSETFKDEIMELTDGRGVDVVINSLAGEKLLLSLDCLAPYGHFCEIGKYDIQQNSKIGMKVLEKNISLHCIDLTEISTHKIIWNNLYKIIETGLVSGEIKPIPHETYSNIHSALKYMSTGKHIGKIILDMETIGNSLDEESIQTKYFTDGTHIVVGGLGGFGLELVEWLKLRGADKVIIISRQSAKNIYQKYKLSLYNGVTINNSNLINAEECDTLLKNTENIKGIWNLAMILNDSLLDNMSKDQWNTTVNVKEKITKNLDIYSRKYCSKLESFVVFSSIASLLGNAGQSNYGYGNSSMEEICRQRRSENLPSLAIQWGPIGNVGFFTKESGPKSFKVYKLQNINDCLHQIDKLLFSKCPVVCSYIKESAGNFTNDVEKKLSSRVIGILGIDEIKLRPTDTLTNMGIDSLQSVEVSNLLKNHGVNIDSQKIGELSWKEIQNFDETK